MCVQVLTEASCVGPLEARESSGCELSDLDAGI